MAFSDLASVKEALRIPSSDTSKDAVLTSILASVDRQLLAMFQLDDTPIQSYTEKFDVLDDDIYGLWLPSYPVASVTTVKISDTTLTTTDYYLARPKAPAGTGHMGLLNLAHKPWPFGRQKTEITWTAGFTAIPGDLKAAATLLAAFRANTDPKLGFHSERIGEYSYRMGQPEGQAENSPSMGLPGTVQSLLANWVRPFASGSP